MYMYPIVSRTRDHPLILKGSPSQVATRLTVFKHVEKHKASNGHVSHARVGSFSNEKNNGHSHDLLTKGLILLMEEIPNNHLAYIKPCKYWDIDHIKWCRISSINSIIHASRILQNFMKIYHLTQPRQQHLEPLFLQCFISTKSGQLSSTSTHTIHVWCIFTYLNR